MPLKQPVIHTCALILTGMFVIACAVLRAHVQSITFDEAFSYLFFAKSLAVVGEFHSNNHVLNSLLMWAATQLFGPSNLALRFPALLGATIYVTVCAWLCRVIVSRIILRFALFCCLTCNPFVMDFMVAARGYGLATAFLMLAIAVLLTDPEWMSFRAKCILASVALGLSFAANYSFALVDGVVLVALLASARGRAFVACVLPGLVVTLLICGYPLAHWKTAQWKNDLWWGAHSLLEMSQSLIDSSLYQPRFSPWVSPLGPWLLGALGILCAAHVAVVRPRIALLAGVTASAAGFSWLAFLILGLPLPLGRTGLYFVPLITLMAGSIAAAPTYGVSFANALRRCITLGFVCLAAYFLLCLRVSYFREYIWNADIEEIHRVLASLHERDIQPAGIYQTALNYYREVYGPERLPEFHIVIPEITPGHAVYVLDATYWQDFIAQEHLVVIYKGPHSNAVIARKEPRP